MRALRYVLDTAIERVAQVCGRPKEEDAAEEEPLPMRNLSQLPDDSYYGEAPMQEEEEEEEKEPTPKPKPKPRRRTQKEAKKPVKSKKRGRPEKAGGSRARGGKYKGGKNIPDSVKCSLDCGRGGQAMVVKRGHPCPPEGWLAEGQNKMDKPICNRCYLEFKNAERRAAKRRRRAAEAAAEEARRNRDIIDRATALAAMRDIGTSE
jgi:hypothetical protein